MSRITTPASAPAKPAPTKAATRRRTTSKTLTEQLAERQAKGIVTKTIVTFWVATGVVYVITAGALYANFGHQNGFLSGHVESTTALIVPLSLDLLTLSCIGMLDLPIKRRGKKGIGTVLAFAVGCSGTLSALAPGDVIGKSVTGGLVVLIAAAKLVTSFAHIDFAQLFSQEVSLKKAAGQVPGRPRRSLADRFEAVQKAQNTRAANKAAKATQQHPVAAVQALPDNAPVSPAVER